MKKIVLIILPALAMIAASWVPAAKPTDPKTLSITVSDLNKGFKRTQAGYCNKKQVDKGTLKHGLVNCYDVEFENQKTTKGMLVVYGSTASFKASGGASWSLKHMASKFQAGLKGYTFTPLKTPKFGQETYSVEVTGSSNGYHYVGPIIAIRVKRYDIGVFALGLKGKFKISGAYPLARTAAARLTKGK